MVGSDAGDADDKSDENMNAGRPHLVGMFLAMIDAVSSVRMALSVHLWYVRSLYIIHPCRDNFLVHCGRFFEGASHARIGCGGLAS